VKGETGNLPYKKAQLMRSFADAHGKLGITRLDNYQFVALRAVIFDGDSKRVMTDKKYEELREAIGT
jgi:hypothetical protein